MAEIFTLGSLISFLTLSALEIVLGIDNVIFITILVGKLPHEIRDKARKIGLFMALLLRIVLLMFIAELARLTEPLIQLFSYGFSGRDIIMITGGLFLIAKSTMEIHDKLEGDAVHEPKGAANSFWKGIVQIMLLDLVFSIDSVVTAIGLAQHVEIMIAAVVVSMIVMFFTAKTVSGFIEKHPTLKMLALSFLLMVGMVLFIEGFGVHVPKGLIYSSMAFSLFVETLNLRLRSRTTNPVLLHTKHESL